MLANVGANGDRLRKRIRSVEGAGYLVRRRVEEQLPLRQDRSEQAGCPDKRCAGGRQRQRVCTGGYKVTGQRDRAGRLLVAGNALALFPGAAL